MKRRELILGVSVAALLVVGVLVSRLASDRDASTLTAADAPLAELDISAADGDLVVAGVRIAVTVTPRPARPFKELSFRFRCERDGQPATVDGGRISFNMKMDMGPNDYRLVRDGTDWIATGVVLPTCPSGGRLWFGNLELETANGPLGARLRLDLAPVAQD